MAETRRDLVVVGASAGGVEALVRLVAQLPSDLSAAVLVVLHWGSDARSNLPAILARAGQLPALEAVDGMPVEPGLIVTASPGHHLTVLNGSVRLDRGPRVNLHRPSVDVLFRSAAAHYGPRACGVVLSGALDDGTSGMRAIRHAGGTTVVQAPEDAIFPSMPTSVLDVLTPDHLLTAEEIGRQLPEILDGASPDRKGVGMRTETLNGPRTEDGSEETPRGVPSQFGCPDCGGVLWESHNAGELPFECRIGHAYSIQSLDVAQQARLEDALWAAVRTLEEQESLARSLLARSTGADTDAARGRLVRRLADAHDRADVVRGFLVNSVAGGPDEAR